MTDQHFYYIGTVLAGAGMWEKQNILTASLSHILCLHHCHWSKPQAQNRKKPKQYSKISPSSHLACHCPCKQWTSKHLCVAVFTFPLRVDFGASLLPLVLSFLCSRTASAGLFFWCETQLRVGTVKSWNLFLRLTRSASVKYGCVFSAKILYA